MYALCVKFASRLQSVDPAARPAPCWPWCISGELPGMVMFTLRRGSGITVENSPLQLQWHSCCCMHLHFVSSSRRASYDCIPHLLMPLCCQGSLSRCSKCMVGNGIHNNELETSDHGFQHHHSREYRQSPVRCQLAAASRSPSLHLQNKLGFELRRAQKDVLWCSQFSGTELPGLAKQATPEGLTLSELRVWEWAMKPLKTGSDVSNKQLRAMVCVVRRTITLWVARSHTKNLPLSVVQLHFESGRFLGCDLAGTIAKSDTGASECVCTAQKQGTNGNKS